MRRIAHKLFGPAGSWQRLCWYWIGIPVGIALAQTDYETGNPVSMFAFCLLVDYLFAFIFMFSCFPMRNVIGAWFYLRRLKRRLDPIAEAIGATASSRCNWTGGYFLHHYSFPNDQRITLEVFNGRFRSHSPGGWGHEKGTEGIEVLLRAIDKMEHFVNYATDQDIDYYRRAAEKGQAIYQSILGSLYANQHVYPQGQGVPHDKVQALKWLTLAASQDESAIKDRDAIARQMTAIQISEAQELARIWKEEKKSGAQ